MKGKSGSPLTVRQRLGDGGAGQSTKPRVWMDIILNITKARVLCAGPL